MSNNLEDKKFLLKSYSWVAFANIITKPFWFLLFIIAARILGKEQFGYYVLATSIVVISSIFIDFGLDFIASREISRDKSKGESYFNRVFQTRMFFLAVIFILLTAFYLFENKLNSIEYYSVVMVLIFQTLTLLLQFFKTVVSSFHNFDLFSKMMIIEKFMIIIFGFVSLYLYADLILFLLALIIANVVTFIYFLVKIRRTFNIVLKQFRFSLVKETVIEALPLLLTVVFAVVYFRADVIILNYVTHDKASVGVYGSIHRLLEMYLMIPVLLMSTSYPIIANKYKDSRSFVISFIDKNLKVITVISLTTAIIIGFNSNFVNHILYGNEYRNGADGLKYIIWTIIPLGFNYMLGNMIVIVKKEKLSAYVLMTASLLSIILNLILIPRFNFIGASIIALIVEVIIFGLYTAITLKHFGEYTIVSIIKKIAIIIGIFLIINAALNYTVGYNPWMNIGLTIILLPLIYNWVGIVRFSELKNLISLSSLSNS